MENKIITELIYDIHKYSNPNDDFELRSFINELLEYYPKYFLADYISECIVKQNSFAPAISSIFTTTVSSAWIISTAAAGQMKTDPKKVYDIQDSIKDLQNKKEDIYNLLILFMEEKIKLDNLLHSLNELKSMKQEK